MKLSTHGPGRRRREVRIARIAFIAAVVIGALEAVGLASSTSNAPRHLAALPANRYETTPAQDARGQKETQGGLDAAKKYGASVKVYDAKFNPNNQFRQLQDAITAYKGGQFDAIVVTPVAGSVICNQVKKAIADGIPIELANLSVCGDKGYRPGAIGYVGMQQQRAEDQD